MSDVVIHGPPQSTYVRSARMVCHEKGVRYDLRPLELKSEAHLALHPFGKVPVLQHGDLTLYETSAIVLYLDEAYPSPPLQPLDPASRALMHQWISSVNGYYYPWIVYHLVHERLVFPALGIAAGVFEADAAVGASDQDAFHASAPGWLLSVAARSQPQTWDEIASSASCTIRGED